MIVKTVTLPCSPARAFALFTQHASEWWPPERRHTGEATSTIAMLESGRFFERASDGREVELGRVLVWRPDEELVLDWFPGTDADHPTRVVVTFTATDEQTRITIEHGPTPASEELYPARAPRYAASWDLVLAALDRYALEHR
ncbi:MAG: SRPBCC domain-containing protein [Kofleriaceae bacterium]